MRFLTLLPLLLLPALLGAQDARMNEQAAKEAVYRIVQHSGLLPNFLVQENAEVKTAVAFIKGRKRVIAYNPNFISSIIDSSRTDWSAVSILAHEIAHHLLGHTLDPSQLHPGDELACDRYSGFILYSMGAALDQSLAAIEVAGDPRGTPNHPPKHARKEAIRQGWQDAHTLDETSSALSFTVKEDFRYVVHFEGDDNTYYVNTADRVVWFNNYAEPIEFGAFTEMKAGDFPYELTWEDQVFYVDPHYNIWRRNTLDAQLKVGRMEPFMSKEGAGGARRAVPADK